MSRKTTGHGSNPLTRLLPESGTTTVAEYAGGLEFSPTEGGDRPWVLCNFAMTADGRAAIDGRSGPIAGPADLELLLALRSRVDAVMIGAGTLRAERYGRIIRDPDVRDRRKRDGLNDDPLAVVVSASLNIPWDIPLFSDGGGEVVIFTSADTEVPETATPVEVVRHEGEVDLAQALSYLRVDQGIENLLCEGGPRLHGDLWRADLVDELFLTIGPRLAGGDGPEIISGPLADPVDLRLTGLLSDSEGALMCRYARASGGQ
jgi:riboflavin-specific deaminase-like protein